ncbi:MAG: HD domain-containing phosphohydrolase [Pseudomonadota bacterium]
MSDIYIPQDSSLIEVPSFGLQPGMYVAELDRPWLETPFAMQGFLVQDQSDIDYVAKHCTYVYVDPNRKVPLSDLQKHIENSRKLAPKEKVSIKAEFNRAKVEFESAAQAMEKVFQKLEKNNAVDVAVMQKVVTPLIDSVFRNREALAALVRLKDKGTYIFHHSLATAVWAAVLGRHLGIDRMTLEELALGASIMDVGMSEIPDELLQKQGPLEPHEIVEIRAHVSNSLKIVHKSGVSKKVLNLVACHHERHDGSGYPQGLSGSEIPPLARIAGLADTYDAMITKRPYAEPRSSFDAIQELSDMKDQAFQGSLVEHFIQTIGMFPTGSVVELNTGEVGVVVEQNPIRRLKPKIVVILDENKQRRDKLALVDLTDVNGRDSNQPSLWIRNELSVGAYGIEPDDYFI